MSEKVKYALNTYVSDMLGNVNYNMPRSGLVNLFENACPNCR